MKFFQRVRAHLLKVTLTIAAALLLVQYWRHIPLESHRFEPLFFIDSPGRGRMRGMESNESFTAFGPDGISYDYLNMSSSQNGTGGGGGGGGGGGLSSDTREPSTKGNNESSLCPPIPPNLSGPIKVIKEFEKFEDVESHFVGLEPGGTFKPKECKARYLVALVIPYRDRPLQLSIFLNNIHRMLMKQQIDYEIFVIEQEGNDPFNRGKLMNVGYVEALRMREFDCFIFHDVDLIPEDDRNLYTCPEQPRHMSVAINKFEYKLPYKEIFGGVCALSKEHFNLTNGFSNLFWGWGGEDDDMYARVRRKGLHVSRYPPTIARYTMLPHSKQSPNPRRFEMLQKGQKRYSTDGLNSLQYERKAIEFKRLYTWILVDIRPPR